MVTILNFTLWLLVVITIASISSRTHLICEELHTVIKKLDEVVQQIKELEKEGR